MDIAAWLRDLELEVYESAFRDNDIDLEVLKTLSADDLKELGISSLGHRKKLLQAAAALAQAHGAVRLPEPPAVVGLPPREAERRQLTVLFCDLVGSTELSAQLDPEDLGELMAAYQACCGHVVRRWGGYVARYLGDGALAYFGWPRAHEHDAERAVRAGLELTRGIEALRPKEGVSLRARVGIATGEVIVGELLGAGSARDEVMGETPNLAARLQALAAPGSVMIGPTTRRLVRGLFELDDLGPQHLKGFAQPLAVWRVAGETRTEGRFEAQRAAGLTPLVGREEELALLLRHWQRARDGEGQVVLLSGEPGIGKSRLVREVRARLEGEPHLRLSYQCSPYHQTSPLHPLIEQLERAAGFERDESFEQKLDKLERLLALGTRSLSEAVPLIAALLEVPTGDRYSLPELTPQRQKQRTLEVLVDQLDGLSAEQPVILVCEDVHWIDPTTQELLDLAIERVQRLPILLLVSFRPEFQPPWSGQPHLSTLSLTRLGRRDGAAMVDEVAGAKAVPAEVTAQIVAKTDGVPLFVEELTKTVLESGLLTDAGDHYEMSGPLPPLAIPATLHDSLMARLDRLAPVKEVAQIGAAIGRDFSYALLAAVAGRPEAELQSALDQLIASELTFRHGTPPDATYSFKHALVQDVAYGTLLRARRQQLHARIANVLEEKFSEAVETQPELLAYHCTQAGLAERATAYWHAAAQRTLSRSGTVEALAQLDRGLDVLSTLPEGIERDRRELDLQIARGGAQLAVKGWAEPETGHAYARARELCERLGETRQLFPVLWGLTVFHVNRGEAAVGRQLAEEMLRLAEEEGDVSAQIASHRAMSAALYHLGKWVPTRTHLERVLTLYDDLRQRPPLSLYAVDHRVMALAFLAVTFFALGYPDKGRASASDALDCARELAHPHSHAFALSHAGEFYCVTHEWTTVLALAQDLIALCTEQGFSHYLMTGKIYHGCALAELGETGDSAVLYRDVATARRVGVPLLLGVLGEAQLKGGRPKAAVRLLKGALSRAERTGERWHEAELHRLLGAALSSLPGRTCAEAEACFHRAIMTARTQSAKMWELRATADLARLWLGQCKHSEAYQLLAPVYGWFTEGFDTADLKEAKALLDQL